MGLYTSYFILGTIAAIPGAKKCLVAVSPDLYFNVYIFTKTSTKIA